MYLINFLSRFSESLEDLFPFTTEEQINYLGSMINIFIKVNKSMSASFQSVHQRGSRPGISVDPSFLGPSSHQRSLWSYFDHLAINPWTGESLQSNDSQWATIPKLAHMISKEKKSTLILTSIFCHVQYPNLILLYLRIVLNNNHTKFIFIQISCVYSWVIH